MKRDFIDEFIDKVSIELSGDFITASQLKQLQDECIALLQKFGQEVPTGYSAQRSLNYFRLKLGIIADNLQEKKAQFTESCLYIGKQNNPQCELSNKSYLIV